MVNSFGGEKFFEIGAEAVGIDIGNLLLRNYVLLEETVIAARPLVASNNHHQPFKLVTVLRHCFPLP